MKSVKFGLLTVVVLIAGFMGVRHFYPHLLPGQMAEESDTAQAGSAPTNSRGAGGQAARGGRGGGGRPAPLVVADAVAEALVNDRLNAVGNGTALASVSVVPLSSGLLTDVRVTPGQQVAAGDVLATIDDEEQRIARDRAAQALDVAKTDVDRLEQLNRSRSTTQAELDRAKAALSDAELALREAELTLSRRSITAPIAGIVGFVSVDTGNYVTTQDELMTIDDRSTIVVEFWVPERFANQLQVGQTLLGTALSAPAIQHEGTIVGIGSRIESDSRTLPAKASIANSDDTLRPGMSFELSLAFAGESFPAVNPLAIQWDSTGSFVWKINPEDKVRREAVRIIQRNPESVLVDGAIADGDQVVIEGLMALRNGATVRMQGAGAPDNARSGNAEPGNTRPEKGRASEAPPQADKSAAKPAQNKGS